MEVEDDGRAERGRFLLLPLIVIFRIFWIYTGTFISTSYSQLRMKLSPFFSVQIGSPKPFSNPKCAFSEFPAPQESLKVICFLF